MEGRCVSCFCAGITKNCKSTGRYRNHISLRFTDEDDFKGTRAAKNAFSKVLDVILNGCHFYSCRSERIVPFQTRHSSSVLHSAPHQP